MEGRKLCLSRQPPMYLLFSEVSMLEVAKSQARCP